MGRNRHARRHFAHVILVKMGQQHVVQRRLRVVTQRVTNVADDPFAGPPRVVGPSGRVLGTRARQFARIDQQGGAIGKDVQARIAAPGADLVDVEHSRLPRRDGAADDILGTGNRGGDGKHNDREKTI